MGWASLVAQLVKNQLAIQETWVGKIPWRREWLLTPIFWPAVHGVARVGHNRVTFTSLHFTYYWQRSVFIPVPKKVSLSHVQLFSMLWTVACQTILSIELPRQDTRVHCHFLLLHCRQSLYQLSHQGSPIPRNPNPNTKECSNYHTITLISHKIAR